jgi:integrase
MLKLTDKAIKALPAPSGHTASGKPRKDYVKAFADPRALRIRVTASGKFFQVDTPTGPVPLGRYGDLTPEAAGREARTIMGLVASGRDPGQERKEARVSRIKAAAVARAQAAQQAFTVRKLLGAWSAARADKGKRQSYLGTALGTLFCHLPDWLERPADTITTAEAVARIDQIKEPKVDANGRRHGGPVAANRCLSYGRAAFGWAKSRRMIAHNPFDDIEAPGHERPRERVLTRDEVGAIWRSAARLPPLYDAFVRFLLLTLMRRDECAGLRWSELSLDGTLWTLPSNRSKNHKAHVTYLTPAVREVIGNVPPVKDCPFVFRSAHNRPISAYSYAKQLLDAAVAEDLGRDVPPWSFHDFRRTGVTVLADMGFPPHVCDRLLNHVAGAALGMLPAVYQKAEFAAERKVALERWAEYALAAAEREPSPKVVAFPKAG